MAQKIENKDERPLQTHTLKQFLAVNTVANRIAEPQDACFYDLTNAQPIGFSNLHAIADAGPPLYDFGAHRVYADWNVNLNNQELLMIATTDGRLFVHYAGSNPPKTIEMGNEFTGTPYAALSGTDALDIVQYDNDTILIIDSSGYWRWLAQFEGNYKIQKVNQEGIAPTKGQCIAVYDNIVWIADGRTLYNSTAGLSSDTPPGYANFNANAGGAAMTINDSTLRSDIKALFVANGLLYIFGETSIDAISDVQVTSTTDSANITTTIITYTRLNISAVVGTEHVESIITYGRLIFFTNQMGAWMLYGYTVQSISTDAANSYYSGIDGTWQFLDFHHYNDAVQWVNRSGAQVDWQNSAGNTVLWQLDAYTPFPFHISGGQVMSNNLLCAAFLVVRKNDPVTGSGNFLVMYQGDATGQNYKWWFADWTQDIGPITHVCTAYVNYAPALYGYIGNKLYQLFANPASAPSARVMTALWDFNDPLSNKQALRAGVRVSLSGAPPEEAMAVTLDTLLHSYPLELVSVGDLLWENRTSQYQPWQNNAAALVQWQNLRPWTIYWAKAPECYSKNLGFTWTSQRGTLFELNAFLLDYKLASRWVGD